jgi:hypothetical protein
VFADEDEWVALECTGVLPLVAPGVRSIELVASDCVRLDGCESVPEAAPERESVDVPEVGPEDEVEPVPVADPEVELELGVDVEPELGLTEDEPRSEDDPELPAVPDDVPELCAKADIATRARLLEKSTEINCRERFVFMSISWLS